jgi:hypothetical protein
MAAPGREMVLVPIELLEKLKNRQPNITPLLNPVKDQLLKSINRLDNTLNDTNLPDDVKSNHINHIEKDLSIYADKVSGVIQPPRPPEPAQTITPTSNNGVFLKSFPKTLQSQANNLLDILETKPGQISWDSDTNEVSIDGKKLMGSNIVDLVGDVIRKRKTPPPQYFNQFLHALAKMNLPEQFIRNTDRIAKFRTYKRGGPTGPTFPTINRKRKLIRDDDLYHSVLSTKRKSMKRQKAIKWLSM